MTDFNLPPSEDVMSQVVVLGRVDQENGHVFECDPTPMSIYEAPLPFNRSVVDFRNDALDAQQNAPIKMVTNRSTVTSALHEVASGNKRYSTQITYDETGSKVGVVYQDSTVDISPPQNGVLIKRQIEQQSLTVDFGNPKVTAAKFILLEMVGGKNKVTGVESVEPYPIGVWERVIDAIPKPPVRPEYDPETYVEKIAKPAPRKKWFR